MTNGPWKYVLTSAKQKSHRGFDIKSQTGALICQNFPSNEPFDPAQKSALGQLLKAAPDLLHALKAILNSGLNRATVETAIAAVTRAEARDQPAGN